MSETEVAKLVLANPPIVRRHMPMLVCCGPRLFVPRTFTPIFFSQQGTRTLLYFVFCAPTVLPMPKWSPRRPGPRLTPLLPPPRPPRPTRSSSRASTSSLRQTSTGSRVTWA